MTPYYYVVAKMPGGMLWDDELSAPNAEEAKRIFQKKDLGGFCGG